MDLVRSTDELLAERERLVAARDVEILELGSSPAGKATSIPTCRDGLWEAGTRLALAHRLAADARGDLYGWIVASAGEGIPRTEIARLAGLSREMVHRVLREEG